MPPVMPAAKFWPTGPRITAVPPVMYSQPLAPQPSTTVTAPELRTREPLARLAGGEQLAGGRAVQAGVADDGVGLGRRQVRRRPDDDGRARQALADIVVGLADQLDAQALDREGAEGLAGRALQLHRQVAGRQAGPCRTCARCGEEMRVPMARAVLRTV